jgi:adenylate cyclase class 2
LTFKGRVHPGAMKVREERETAVLDAPATRAILEGIGFAAWFIYEKYREEYMAGDVILAIDETPVGTWMELEGPEAGILTVAEALGRSPQDFILASYRTLFLERRGDLALGAHMVFPPR